MTARSRRAAAAQASPAPAALEPLATPTFAIVALVAAIAVCVSVSFKIYDFDLWEHLVVGKYLWSTHRIPTTQLWTWPTYGAPAMTPSWLFRALLWPFWSVGGATGLFVWRWATTLLAFGLAFATARRLGARPLVTLAVIVVASLSYRQRSMVRPETLVAVLLALQMLVLESRRAEGAARAGAWAAWLIAIAALWINVHLSFVLGFANLAFHALDALAAPRTAAQPGRGSGAAVALAWTALAALAASFLNPNPLHAIVQPFQFALSGRDEIIYRTVGELGRLDWRLNWRNGLPLLVVGWPLLALLRFRRRGLDLVEALTLALMTGLALFAQRTVGFYALAATPYVARDLSDALEASPLKRAHFPEWARALAWSAGLVLLCLPEWSRPHPRFGIALDLASYPVAACDYIQRAGIRGRAFNHFAYGGYMEYRFWPDRDRLPFMDGHLESGTERDRTLYTYAQVDSDAWHTLDAERHFDYAVLTLNSPTGSRLRKWLADDEHWALVFADDAAAVFVRRDGGLARVAARDAYRVMRVDPFGLDGLVARCATDPALRAETARECERQKAESRWTASASSLLAEIDLMNGHRAEARRELETVLAIAPLFGRAHERIGLIDLAEGHPAAALRRFQKEYQLHAWPAGFDLRRGMVYQAQNDLRAARAAYRRELDRNPANAEARDSLASVEMKLAK